MRLLLVVPRHPFPPRRGDQRRTVQAVEALCGEHEVTLLVPEPAMAEEGATGVRFSDRLGRLDGRVRVVTYPAPGIVRRGLEVGRALVAGLPLQTGVFASPGLAAALARHAPEADCVVLQLVRLAPLLEHVGDRPLVVDLIDSLALSTGRRAEVERRPKRWFFRWEARRIARWEELLAERAECTLLVSVRDREMVADRLPAGAGARLQVVPVAVPATDGGRRRDDGPPVLALTGNLGYFPTRDGLRWFLRSVWPRLRRARPEVRLVLAGSRPPRWVRRLDGRDGIEVRPDPEDLGEVLRTASISLAPMRCGAGQPLKVLEAWAASVPVVATRWTARGADARPGKDLMVADGADEWLGAIVALIDDPHRAREIVASARGRLEERYAPGVVRNGWLEAVEAAAAARSRA